MQTPIKISKVIGPPGTGKTTELLRLLGAAARKYDPERIGAVSFTKAAVKEMRSRAAEEAGLEPDNLKNIQTIHSLCFALAGIKKDQVAQGAAVMKKWNEDFPTWAMPLDHAEFTEDDHYKETHADRAWENKKTFNLMNIFRNQLLPAPTWPDESAQRFWADWSAWMTASDYVDFTAMIELADRAELAPDVDVLFVDEAQDLTPLQLRVINRWADRALATVFAGDSDQCIYRWAGSCPEVFRDLPAGWVKPLTQSYRVSRAVHEYAMTLISRADDRENVVYEPRDASGAVFTACPCPDLSLDGSHMILARCNHQLGHWRQWLLDAGIPWHNPYRPSDRTWNPLTARIFRAARAYVMLREGLNVRKGDLTVMIGETRAKGNIIPGMKGKAAAILDDNPGVLDLFGIAGLGLFTAEFLNWNKPIEEVLNLTGQAGTLLERMEIEDIVTAAPRVVLGTIHSVKGGEADHVWIDTSAAMQVARAVQSSRQAFNDELRVAYVAATRARETVGLLRPQGRAMWIW